MNIRKSIISLILMVVASCGISYILNKAELFNNKKTCTQSHVNLEQQETGGKYISRTKSRYISKSPEGGTYPLPKSLDGKIVHFPSVVQGKDQCGHYSTFNALAIQKLVNQNKELTAADIQQENNCCEQVFPNQPTYCYELVDIAKKHGLQRLIILGHNHKTDRIFVQDCTPDVRDIANNLEQFCQNIQDRGPDCHFICDIGGHWILISAIKGTDETQLCYLDSGNQIVTPQSDTNSYVNRISGLLKIA